MSQVIAVFSHFDLQNLLDILLVALLFYGLLYLLRGTRAAPLLRGLFVLILFVLVLRSVLNVPTLGWLLDQVVPALIVTIPVIFQPELRRVLENLGQRLPWSRQPWTTSAAEEMRHVIEEVAEACAEMSRRRLGALVVMERSTPLDEFAAAGVRLDAHLSSQLLLNIFFPNAPLHDGAALVRRSQVLAAGAVLPLSEDVLDSYQYGMRHRAAIGISEETDAVAVVVSEETGAISVAQRGRIVRWLDQEKLVGLLEALFRLHNVRDNSGGRRR